MAKYAIMGEDELGISGKFSDTSDNPEEHLDPGDVDGVIIEEETGNVILLY